ncbi:MAG: hypothetical protein HY751_02090 [Nitrospinae bacterium]|nr:hypothetical protein [Nitrospinota bacterium]
MAQLDPWKESLHARAAGPGLLGQLDPENQPDTANSCYFCHAPLAEQQEFKSASGGGYAPNRGYDGRLKHAGVSCAVCHVRYGKVYGPPRNGKLETAQSDLRGHNGYYARDFYGKSEFCAACHQLNDGYKLNGKLLVNTYAEWQKSNWAKDGVQCQNCHMPNREHLFKGIHDKRMTLSALDIQQVWDGKKAALAVTNSGAGHYFPTYVTPLVIIRAHLEDSSGKTIPGSEREYKIGRKVSLDISVEEYDTRLAPGEKREYIYDGHIGSASRIVFSISVYPDYFYHGFFKSTVENASAPTMGLISQALTETGKSSYKLWSGSIELQ